jgi:hypothetical protein
MVLWWIGALVLLVVVLPVVAVLVNRLLSALERVRDAADDVLDGGLKLAGEVRNVPELLATTDQTIAQVQAGAVRYAGSVQTLLDAGK